jgi:hypothetical protein
MFNRITIAVTLVVWSVSFALLQRVKTLPLDIRLDQSERVAMATIAALVVLYAILTWYIRRENHLSNQLSLETIKAMGWTCIWWDGHPRLHLLGAIHRGDLITSTACGASFPVSRIHIGHADRAPVLPPCRRCLRASAFVNVPILP